MKGYITLVGSLALMAMAGPASAAVVIDFGSGFLSPGGTITVSGGQATGVNIGVQSMIVTGSSGFDGTYDLYGAGPNGLPFTNGSALVNFNTSTGAFTVVGGVCVLGNFTCNGTANTLVASTTLATGTASSASITSISGTTLVFQESDTKAASLLAALGLTGTSFRLMSATFNYTGPGTGPYTVTSTDIQNMGVPEPSSILLLGSVMLGVASLVRRRTRKA